MAWSQWSAWRRLIDEKDGDDCFGVMQRFRKCKMLQGGRRSEQKYFKGPQGCPGERVQERSFIEDSPCGVSFKGILFV